MEKCVTDICMFQKILANIFGYEQTDLENPWKCRSQVLSDNQKYFTIKNSDEVNNAVSIDKLKPTLILETKTARIKPPSLKF